MYENFGRMGISTRDRTSSIHNIIRAYRFICKDFGYAYSMSAYLRLPGGFGYDHCEYRFAIYEWLSDSDAGVLIAETENGVWNEFFTINSWMTLNFPEPHARLERNKKYFLAVWGWTSDVAFPIYARHAPFAHFPNRGIHKTVAYNGYPNPLNNEIADYNLLAIYCTFIDWDAQPGYGKTTWTP